MNYTEKEKITRQLNLLKECFKILKTKDLEEDIKYLENKLKDL